MAGLTLDAGALIAIERHDRRLSTALASVRHQGGELAVPAPVLAQVWQGATSVRLALLLRSCTIVAFDEELARRAGELLARAGSSDVVDAALVVTGAGRGHAILTDDLAGIQPLVGSLGRRLRVVPLRSMR